ncbi:hypothetical protein [Ensifer sp. Root954]|uniref:hypothetical protein n=1 Tax=Ensifer sp. Root954 TaxID=1736611 RepID=UPI0012E34415|nr:hypothetical protein [Ensifer sp. Root954]
MAKRRPPAIGAGVSGLVPHHGEAIQRMTTKSVLTPMLLLLAIALTTLLPAIYFSTGWTQEVLTYLVVLVVVVSVGFYTYFAIRDPDRLQSEEYLVELRRIAVLGETGKPIQTIDGKAEQTPNVFVEGEEAVK